MSHIERLMNFTDRKRPSRAFLTIDLGSVGAWFITPWEGSGGRAGRHEWRPYGMMPLPVSGQNSFITPCLVAESLSGRHEW